MIGKYLNIEIGIDYMEMKELLFTKTEIYEMLFMVLGMVGLFFVLYILQNPITLF